MANEMDPIIGNWYCHLSKGQLFQVISLDDAMVAIQRFDGDLEELELDAWASMDIEAAPPPEDWTGPIDSLDPDDCGFSECAMHRGDWRDATAEFPRCREAWEPDDGEAQLDDWEVLLPMLDAQRRSPPPRRPARR